MTTVATTIDAAGWLRNYLESDDGDNDLAREMLAAFAEALMSAEASAQCGAAYNERTDDRANSRNGYRHRDWDTRVGTIDLAIPKLREGSYYRVWLLEHRRRGEQALASVVAQSYVEGVSTRRVDDLVKAMGIHGMSASQVSRLAASLDAKVAEFRNRPLDAGPYRYVWIDALTQKVREGGRVVNVSAVIATSVNNEGRQRDHRVRHRHDRVDRVVDRVPALACGTRAVGCRARHLRRSRRHQSCDRPSPVGGVVATLPDSFHGQFVHESAQGVVADGRHAGALDLRATRLRQHLVAARRRRHQAG